MSGGDAARELAALRAPGEEAAAARAWPAVRDAFAEREPVASQRRIWPALAAAAVLAASAAAAVTSPGQAVLDEMRERIGVERSSPGLFSLPAGGRLLVQSAEGAWVVHRDGSKRLLPGYREASWSPFGRFVVAARDHELAALEPDGSVRWTLARPGVRLPRWGGTLTDTRVAYVSGRTLRVVAGDGTGDRRLARTVLPVAPAWRPGGRHVLAYGGADERVVVAETDAGRRLWRTAPVPGIAALQWSGDGRRLLVRGRDSLVVFAGDGRRRATLRRERGTTVAGAALAPSGDAAAFVELVGGRSTLSVVDLRAARPSPRPIFSGAGHFGDVTWSPDGRWLLLSWPDADQWVFVRSAEARGVHAVSNISAQFGGAFPLVAGWTRP